MAENDAPQRWQEIRIAQFGFVNNTVLALATGSLGFAISIARETTGVWRGALFFAVAMLLLSHFFALWCAVNRFWDFSETFKRTIGKPTATTEENRERGVWSRWLLYLQLLTFGLGIIALTCAALPSTLPN